MKEVQVRVAGARGKEREARQDAPGRGAWCRTTHVWTGCTAWSDSPSLISHSSKSTMVGVGELQEQLLRGGWFPARLMKTAGVTQRCGCARVVELFTLKWLILITWMSPKFKLSLSVPRWLSGKESGCQCRRCGFDPWSGKISRGMEQRSPCAATIEPVL